MITVDNEFKDRVEEIEIYFNLLRKVEDDYLILSHKSEIEKRFEIDTDLFKVLKANGFLLLYNLIESTILNCIVAVFDELEEKKQTYLNVSEAIRKYWLKNKYKHDEKIKKESVVNQFYKISSDIFNNVIMSIDKTKIEYAGSIDTVRIAKIADDLGIILNMSYFRKNKHGVAFEEIRKHRNNLAHGKMTFSNIGKNVTYNGDGIDGTKSMGLFHFKKYTIEHLSSFIDNIRDFIKNEKYRDISI
ncbi:MAG: hypothetical protein K8R54_20045 [Bacteroidales bacterium]|nr:hypothetical protein [Bacteroidales bacterium]